MNVTFEKHAFDDFSAWALEDKKLYQRIIALINDILRHPFSGIGKPEPLKHQLKGYWSRRINEEYRLVYKIENETLISPPASIITYKIGNYYGLFGFHIFAKITT